MSDQAASGSRGEWPLEQRGRNSGAVRLCDLDLAGGMLTLDCEPQAAGNNGTRRAPDGAQAFPASKTGLMKE